MTIIISWLKERRRSAPVAMIKLLFSSKPLKHSYTFQNGDFIHIIFQTCKVKFYFKKIFFVFFLELNSFEALSPRFFLYCVIVPLDVSNIGKWVRQFSKQSVSCSFFEGEFFQVLVTIKI